MPCQTRCKLFYTSLVLPRLHLRARANLRRPSPLSTQINDERNPPPPPPQVLELATAANRARHANAAARASHMGGPGGGPGLGLALAGVSVAGSVAAMTQRSAVFGAIGPPRPKGFERAGLGALVPVHVRALLPGIHTSADGAPTWQQAR